MAHPFLSLGRWYATPLSHEQAAELRTQLEERRAERLRRTGRGCVACQIGSLIARFWLGESITEDHARLAALLKRRHSPRAKAMLELAYGQLLMSRRLPGAISHLERGFADGRDLFAPADYFTVLKRHVLLRLLPPDGDNSPLDLPDLLTTARVIERFVGTRRGPALNGTPPEHP